MQLGETKATFIGNCTLGGGQWKIKIWIWRRQNSKIILLAPKHELWTGHSFLLRIQPKSVGDDWLQLNLTFSVPEVGIIDVKRCTVFTFLLKNFWKKLFCFYFEGRPNIEEKTDDLLVLFNRVEEYVFLFDIVLKTK